MVYGTAWYAPPVVFARNDGNLTRMEVLLGLGEMEGVLKVLVNDVEIPAGVPGANMTGTGWYNIPLVPYTNFNNTVVLGSFVAWLVLMVPIFFAARYGVAKYRATIGERVRQSRFYRAVTASQVYNLYKMFRP